MVNKQAGRKSQNQQQITDTLKMMAASKELSDALNAWGQPMTLGRKLHQGKKQSGRGAEENCAKHALGLDLDSQIALAPDAALKVEGAMAIDWYLSRYE